MQMGETNTMANKRFSIEISPREVAENLPAEVATYALHRHEARQKPAGLFRSAWNNVEYAMTRQSGLDDDLRLNAMTEANYLIGRALADHSVTKDTELALYVLSTYIPVFAKRAVGESISSADCQDIYSSLGSAMRLLSPLNIDQPPQWSMLEVATLALSARAHRPDLLLFPTSPREECSSFASLNHDSYFLANDSKIPVQQKLIPTEKQYDECITMLTFLPIVERAAKRTGIEVTASSEKLNYLLGLIVADVHGVVLSSAETKFLNHMTSAVVSHRWSKSEARVAA